MVSSGLEDMLGAHTAEQEVCPEATSLVPCHTRKHTWDIQIVLTHMSPAVYHLTLMEVIELFIIEIP